MSVKCRVCKKQTDKPKYVNAKGEVTKTAICPGCLENQHRRGMRGRPGRTSYQPGRAEREYEGWGGK